MQAAYPELKIEGRKENPDEEAHARTYFDRAAVTLRERGCDFRMRLSFPDSSVFPSVGFCRSSFSRLVFWVFVSVVGMTTAGDRDLNKPLSAFDNKVNFRLHFAGVCSVGGLY